MDQFSKHPLYRKHNLDSAMSSLWEFYKIKFIPLFIFSLVVSLIIQYASTLIDLTELQTVTDPQELLARMKDYIMPVIIVSLLSLLFTTMLHYYIIYNPVENEDSIFRCIVKSLRYFIPYLIIMVLLVFIGSFALLLGFIALIIGIFFAALYLLMLYLFILPLLMIEGPDIANTIKRTFILAHRNFWPNMGWTAVFIIIVIVVSVILSGIILIPFTGSFMKAFINPQEAGKLVELTTNPVFIFLSAAVNALVFPLLPIFACILYFNGKAREEESTWTE